MWEAPQNRRGGRWLLHLDNSQRKKLLDSYWVNIMLCLIGEAFNAHSDLVNGAVVNVRTKGDKISLWLGDSSQQADVLASGKLLKELMGIGLNTKIGFEAHQDNLTRSSSTMKSLFEL